jgi:hypothetical protein
VAVSTWFLNEMKKNKTIEQQFGNSIQFNFIYCNTAVFAVRWSYCIRTAIRITKSQLHILVIPQNFQSVGRIVFVLQ